VNIRVAAVNGTDPDESKERDLFEGLRPRYPEQRPRIECHDDGLTARAAGGRR